MRKKKLSLLIDSDVTNEIDDQFALCYAFACSDKLKVLGVTIAPYRVEWQQNMSIRDGLIDSRNETYRILRLFGIKHDEKNPFVYLGCDGYLSEDYNSTNPAVEKIISVARKQKELLVCCLGPLSNVAMALRIAPDIAPYLKVVWLGTGNILLDKFCDANFIKDKVAFYEVLASKADFTILPSFLARNIVTSTYEFSNNTKTNNVVKYLYNLLDHSSFSEKKLSMKMKEIYDIAPIGLLLYPEKFIVKTLNAKYFVKEKGVKLPSKDRNVRCVVEVPRHFEIWEDFTAKISEVKNFYIKPNIFFTSDTHFGHEWKVRKKQVPFKNVEEMNSELVRRWNNKVSPNDTVYHLGDFGDYNYVKKLNGHIILICGNYEHDDFKDFKKFRKKLLALGFEDVIEKGVYLDESVLGRKVYLTHKPTDHDKTCLNLFGHVHSLKLVEKYGFNVCVTYHYFSPLAKEAVKRYLDFVEKYADQDVWE